ncbi:acyl-CoA carboxylase epsilon subunit [Pseudolysinimonas sp.]|uniref:acyl-CoA carboxylase epsilon subunit n=1 Tax=Pseudolysinimonas sp. TaxID=2680009 RepID=UPI00286A29EC|nr:acyl-CoA carboxylase epsilon subunit [Pseudolysinimonas sp.]
MTSPEIRILGGQATAEEIAAATAVLTAALDELAGESRRRGESGLTAWQVSQRPVRKPLPHGAWRNFEA